jgi:DNA recombination protein RmuC
VGTNLGRATNAYNKMVGSLESQVMTQARRFEDHGAGSAKAIARLPMIEASPRPLTKMAAPPAEDDPPQIAAE